MEKHCQMYPGCPFISGETASLNLQLNLDEGHPFMKILKRTEEVIREVRISWYKF